MNQPNPSAAPNPASYAQGGNPWNAGKYQARSFFTYESDITASLAAGSPAVLTFNIAGDSDFFWTKFAVFALVGGAATVDSENQIPAVTMLLINTTTGRQYSSSAVPLPNMAGSGQLPFILPQIVLWKAKATIQIQLQNEGNAAYSNLHLSFHGIKAFTDTSPTG
jgi:hypothetical protein